MAVRILCDNYSPGELEERIGMTLWDVVDGMEIYVEENEEIITELLKEDLHYD